MTERIDLTDDGTETSVYVAKDDGSRKRVVALAEGLKERLLVAEPSARKRVRTAVDGVELPIPAANGEMLQGRTASAAINTKPVPAQPAAPTPLPAAPHAAASAPINNLLGQLHAERLSRMSEDRKAAMRSPGKQETSKAGTSSAQQPPQPAAPAVRASAAAPRADTQHGSSLQSRRNVTVLSYNLWFNEELALVERMRAVGDLIEREGFPDLLLFQEVTQNIVLIFRQSDWFRRYRCSPVPEDKSYFTLLLARRDTVTLPAMQPWLEKDFGNSCMGRSILYTRASVGGRALVVGTTHLESPVGPGPQQMVTQRQEQLQESVRELEAAAGPGTDVLLAGDLNWSDVRDGPVRTPARWCDAWSTLMPQRAGLTWDPVANPMLTSRFKGGRLDRVLCRLSSAGGAGSGAGRSTPSSDSGGTRGWQLDSIKMIGTQALPGLTHEFKGRRLPVLPSDHFGLLVKLLPAEAAPSAATVGRVLGGADAPSTSAAAPTTAAAPVVADAKAANDGRVGRSGGSDAAAGTDTAGQDRRGAQESGAKPAKRRLPRPNDTEGSAAAGTRPGGALEKTAAAGGAAAGAKVPAVRDQDKATVGPGPARVGSSSRRRDVATVDLSLEDDDDDDVVVL